MPIRHVCIGTVRNAGAEPASLRVLIQDRANGTSESDDHLAELPCAGFELMRVSSIEKAESVLRETAISLAIA